MAFKPRHKDNGGKPNDGIEVGSVDSRKESSTKPKPYNLPDKKTFRDQAIEVLNILDKKGINIYDETRTPGMYLRGAKTKPSNNLIKFLSGGESNSASQHQQHQETIEENSESSNATNALLDFFSNNN